jgi:hypothetical protein
MNKTLKYILIGLATVGGLYLLAVLFFTVLMVSQVTKDPVPQTSSAETVEYARDAYNEGCMGEGAGYAYCNCTFNQIMNIYGIDEFIRASIKYEMTGDLDINITPALTACLHLAR